MARVCAVASFSGVGRGDAAIDGDGDGDGETSGDGDGAAGDAATGSIVMAGSVAAEAFCC